MWSRCWVLFGRRSRQAGVKEKDAAEGCYRAPIIPGPLRPSCNVKTPEQVHTPFFPRSSRLAAGNMKYGGQLRSALRELNAVLLGFPSRHIGPASRLRWADPEALLHAQRSDTAHATDAAAAALLAALRLALAQQAALELVREREAGHESSSDEEVSWQGAESDSDSRSSVTTHAQLTQAEESLNSELESHLSHPDDPLKARALIAKAISAAAGICLGTTGSAQQSTAAAAAAAAPSLGRAWAVYVLMAWCGVDAPAHVIDAIADAVNIVLAEVTSQVLGTLLASAWQKGGSSTTRAWLNLVLSAEAPSAAEVESAVGDTWVRDSLLSSGHLERTFTTLTSGLDRTATGTLSRQSSTASSGVIHRYSSSSVRPELPESLFMLEAHELEGAPSLDRPCLLPGSFLAATAPTSPLHTVPSWSPSLSGPGAVPVTAISGPNALSAGGSEDGGSMSRATSCLGLLGSTGSIMRPVAPEEQGPAFRSFSHTGGLLTPEQPSSPVSRFAPQPSSEITAA